VVITGRSSLRPIFSASMPSLKKCAWISAGDSPAMASSQPLPPPISWRSRNLDRAHSLLWSSSSICGASASSCWPDESRWYPQNTPRQVGSPRPWSAMKVSE
jgi:hypothetical protein